MAERNPDVAGSPLRERHRHWQQLIRQTLQGLLGDCSEYALLGFPRHGNLGDSAIWTGQVTCLESMGLECVYASLPTTEQFRYLDRLPAKVPLILTGGGNFGDLWPRQQVFREALLLRYKDRQVIQLPQSIHFDDPVNLRRAAKAVAGHPRFDLLVRDEQSEEIAQTALGVAPRLLPDMAVFLTPISRPSKYETLWLMRDDKEKAIATPVARSDDIRIGDWSDYAFDSFAYRANLSFALRLERQTASIDFGDRSRRLRIAAMNRLASVRTMRALAVITSARTIVTDRLHGHILAMVASKRHAILDNTYGKLSAYHDTWASDISLARRVTTADEAVRSLAGT